MRTVKLVVPVAVGVPVIVPPVLRLSPAGRELADSDQVRGAVPPVAAIVWEYTMPTVPPGNKPVVMLGAAAMVIERDCVAVAPTLSRTRMGKGNDPAADGVPAMTPVVVFKLKPVGS